MCVNSYKLFCFPSLELLDKLIIGFPPPELSCLNEVELALISPARINKHIFVYSTASYEAIDKQ